jgi:hypothetical protein
MDRIVLIPCGGVIRESAFIIKDEKAKKTPPIKPHPTADSNVRKKMKSSII